MDMLDRCAEIFYTERVRYSGQMRWAMDLSSYKAIRAAAEARIIGRVTDSDAGAPGPNDTLFGLPVDVRVRTDDGAPHLEPIPWHHG
jgi:hypothetical protein